MIGSVRSTMLRAGLIAVLNGHFSVQELIEISDALLATPLTVAALSLSMRDSTDAMAELSARHGEHMLFGAANVAHAADVSTAVAHGARFLLLDHADEVVVRMAHRQGVLAVPRVTTSDEAQRMVHLGSRAVHFHPAEASGPAALHALSSAWPQLTWLAGGGIDDANMAAYLQAGAAVITVGNRSLPPFDWRMRDLIRTARNLRTAWQAAI